ncbi:hypothetical protein L1077_02185 [Pseudoalteromonas luteoviolacea]|uniref:hypothetical protein n=1 Tax=Pseudoalteromonas luteoviolacea TaxID=43657 RepID=UPI001F390A65|nr:hypothetical protein [Pseudoalteromonas luteoviolacea]MCF6438242.1 hypothetical protein [Pseudoalteromonas luteoviolacea]
MKVKELALAATVLTLAACQSTNQSNKDVVAANDSVKCEYRAKLGSNIKKRYCYSTHQMKQMEEGNRRVQVILDKTRGNSWYEK